MPFHQSTLIFLLFFLLTMPSYAIDTLPEFDSHEQAEKAINAWTLKISQSSDLTKNYIKRGQLYFLIHDFERAVEDFSKVISLDKDLDDAYYWRGMELGCSGFIKDGIADLTVYITRNPDSSLAYTKRGVRYLCLNQMRRVVEK